MAGKQAKILSEANIDDLLLFSETTRRPLRNKVMVLLSAKAGLRAGEIAHLKWEMITDPTGAVGTTIELPDHAAKRGSGRKVPLHGDLRRALTELGGSDSGDRAGDRVGTGRANDATEHCGLVCQRLSTHWSRRLFFPLGATNVHYPRRSARLPRWWLVARCAASGWPSVDPNNAAVH
jgi:integrase